MTTQELWQSQAIDGPRITPAYLRGLASDAVRKVRRWNLVEYSGSLFGVAVAVVLWFLYADFWTRTSNVCTIVASIIYAWRWRQLATAAVPASDLGAIDTLRFHRRELVRQHAVYRGSWRWVVPLYLPAVALWVYGMYRVTGSNDAKLALMIPIVAAGFALGVWCTESRAAKLRREIELLDLMTK